MGKNDGKFEQIFESVKKYLLKKGAMQLTMQDTLEIKLYKFSEL